MQRSSHRWLRSVVVRQKECAHFGCDYSSEIIQSKITDKSWRKGFAVCFHQYRFMLSGFKLKPQRLNAKILVYLQYLCGGVLALGLPILDLAERLRLKLETVTPVDNTSSMIKSGTITRTSQMRSTPFVNYTYYLE